MAATVEEQLFMWCARNRDKLVQSDRNGVQLGKSRRGNNTVASTALHFIRQFDFKAFEHALAISDHDCDANSNPGTIAWHVRKLRAIADNDERTAQGTFCMPPTVRMDAIKMLRAITALAALSHAPAARGIVVGKTPDDNPAGPSHNQQFRARIFGKDAS